TARQGWNRQQLLMALRQYIRLPFGRLHNRNPDIVEIAEKIGRTPSALAMKACNFASLDPAFRASNRRGLDAASAADRSIWKEFSENAEKIASEIEEVYSRLGLGEPADEPNLKLPEGETEAWRFIRVRRVQSFFRSAVLTSYSSRCAISGLAIPELLIA